MGHFVKVFPGLFALSPVFATLRDEIAAGGASANGGR